MNSTSSKIVRLGANITNVHFPLISDEDHRVITAFLNLIISIMNIIGVITNAVNIRVFINQGLSGNSSTIALFALAISDLLGCILLAFSTPCAFLYFSGKVALADIITCGSVVKLAFSYPHLVFSRVTCWITVYISIERSISVVIPLKVKSIFTPKVTTIAMCLTYCLILIPHFCYPIGTIQWIFDPVSNASVALAIPGPAFNKMLSLGGLIFDTITPSMVFAVVAVAFTLMVNSLRKTRKFRQRISGADGKFENNTTKAKRHRVTRDSTTASQIKPRKGKEHEIVKTIALVLGIFLVSQIMSYVPGLALTLFPDSGVGRLNQNLMFLSYSIRFFSDSFNSSTNMFVYITVSSRFKASFRRVFYRKEQKN